MTGRVSSEILARARVVTSLHDQVSDYRADLTYTSQNISAGSGYSVQRSSGTVV
jgi:hypothetical protein